MSPLNVKLDTEELEQATHRLLGRFFVAFARLEMNLSLRIGADGTFHEKLECFLNAAVTFYGDSSDRFCELLAWYLAADSARETRNRFAHGRWAFHAPTQRVIHVLGFPPGLREERRYSLKELDAIVQDTEALDSELYELREVFV